MTSADLTMSRDATKRHVTVKSLSRDSNSGNALPASQSDRVERAAMWLSAQSEPLPRPIPALQTGFGLTLKDAVEVCRRADQMRICRRAFG